MKLNNNCQYLFLVNFCYYNFRMLKFIFLLILLPFILSRILEQSFTNTQFKRQNNWFYLDKMVLSRGIISIQFYTIFSGDLKQPIQVQFGVISDQFFQTQSRYKCNNAQNKMTTYSHTINPNKKASVTRINMDNHDEHLYYFVIKDCNKELSGNKTTGGYLVTTKLVILNSESHLGSQEDMVYIYPMIIVISAWLIWRIWNEKPMEGQKNWVQVILFMGILARIAGLIWKGIGFFFYWYKGKNYTAFEIFYLGLHGLSEVMIICIVILISFGWYILFVNHDDFDIVIALLALLGALNIVLNILNVINDDSADKYHMYDTVPSIIQTIFRVIALLCLIGGIKSNWAKFSPERKWFIVKFGLYGAVYIMSLPITIFLATLFKKSEREEMVFLTSELFQLSSNILMTYLLTAKNSAYRKINIDNSSFLPENEKNEKFF